ncbi:MAG TPA: hypothetical protein DCY48_01630 [Candidatus Magasanikbacteria bacterium]|nr:MAG: hypothetical protein A3I74_00540 [Candidatus Magasanikbacteria bacterium RIFCSPLOWO2_02_FULL_47_16]OGH80061.1 MAG: hypothetical protein A3C10_02685 [Candidatus Magasanikbacteria bacterium RIFCSPHIGHO2_02_FULL_48_18]HAZ28457.1 hypothetical protein [Candidatus Magasanikbacteria bacterium]
MKECSGVRARWRLAHAVFRAATRFGGPNSIPPEFWNKGGSLNRLLDGCSHPGANQEKAEAVRFVLLYLQQQQRR